MTNLKELKFSGENKILGKQVTKEKKGIWKDLNWN